MKPEFLLALYLVAHLGLLAWSFRFEGPSGWRLWFLRLILVGTSYDNFILLLSGVGMGAQWYVVANVPRFILHAAVLPFLTLFALSAMQASGVALARRRGFMLFCFLFTVSCWVYGVWHEVFLLELGPVSLGEHQRLSSLSPVPPLATIATNLLVLPMAFSVWRASSCPWFFLGALFIFLLNGATGSQPWGFVAGNGAEVVFIGCLLLSERFLRGMQSRAS